MLYNLFESVRIASILLTPFMPETAALILSRLGTDKTGWDDAVWGGLPQEFTTEQHDSLFPRIDVETEMAYLSEMTAPKPAMKKPELAPTIGIEQFAASELRAAKVLSCEKIEKSDKLLKLTVDLGWETRQVVSGIANFYTPDQLVGKTVVLVANLAPAKLRGVESNGMILAADAGKEVRVVFLPDDIPAGSKIR